MSDFLKRTWAEINLDHIRHNVAQIKSLLKPSCMLMGVVKADAYGHGDKYIADELVRMGVNWFGVSNINEAMSLRRQGVYYPILIFGVTPPAFVSQLCEYKLTQAVFSYDYACRLQTAAQEAHVTVDIHIKLDTGMGRLGFCWADRDTALDQIERIYYMKNLQTSGVFTHFSCADEQQEESVTYTRGQFEKFERMIDLLARRGVYFSLRHCCNSGGVLRYPEMHLDMVRPGICLYGISPSDDCQGLLDLRPAMEIKSTISMVKQVAAGTQIGYGRTFTAPHAMKIATVPIGYADGYPRLLSNRGEMLVGPYKAPIVGKVCMDQTMLDVTHIPEVSCDMPVTVVGRCEGAEIPMEEVAAKAQTCAYETMCVVGKRVPRVYYKDKKEYSFVDYVMQQQG